MSGPWDTARGTISSYIAQAREDVMVLLAEVERLAHDNEEMSLAMSSVHVGDLMDALAAAEAECERLAGRVAALTEVLRDYIEATSFVCSLPNAPPEPTAPSLEAWERARSVLADVGGSE